ncbi:unnamed protein product [Tilletia controversa]|uniref:Uncharacterized protein n=3 Tax=Tilletia TaxID=13289 RepID=A0A8X7MZL0_9BASI|nr:hypothetical protein CF336_g24 [Tilletia laevis]KAE8205957.1 hypothetical protein CF328_g185 [Tilletia controversa]KAE8265648.1 hypothetical protein A4X03_0g126 [Tilletia caries]KAE8208963.1 hypothetical protein CF335_g26 [Tilletia laevis]KAE8255657.1 hypothetical protein A4X06_0g317 [Tilletia controversa]
MSSLSPNALALLAVMLQGRPAPRPQTDSRASDGALDRLTALTSALLAHGAQIALQAQPATQQQQVQQPRQDDSALLSSLTSTMGSHLRSLEAQQNRIEAVAQGIQSQLALMNQTLASAAMQQQYQTRIQASGRASSGLRRGSSSLSSARRSRNLACSQAQAHDRIVVGAKRSYADTQGDSQPTSRKRRMLLDIDPPQTNGSL